MIFIAFPAAAVAVNSRSNPKIIFKFLAKDLMISIN